jgi:hypothetical protein
MKLAKRRSSHSAPAFLRKESASFALAAGNQGFEGGIQQRSWEGWKGGQEVELSHTECYSENNTDRTGR